MVWDIFNSLRGLVFQKIKHSVFPIFFMFSCLAFLTTGSEVLKTKRGFYQGNIKKNKKSLIRYTGVNFPKKAF